MQVIVTGANGKSTWNNIKDVQLYERSSCNRLVLWRTTNGVEEEIVFPWAVIFNYAIMSEESDKRVRPNL